MKLIFKLLLVCSGLLFLDNPAAAQNQKKTARVLKRQVKDAIYLSGVDLKFIGPYDPMKKSPICSPEISDEGLEAEDLTFVFVLSKNGKCNYGGENIFLFYNSKGRLVNVFHHMVKVYDLLQLYDFLPKPINDIYYWRQPE